MKLQLYKNEYLWSKEGTHVCGEHGFAVRAEEDMEVEIDDEHFERVLEMVMAQRAENAPMSIWSPAPEAIPPVEAPLTEEVSE